MAWMVTFALFGVVSAMTFASFVLARLLAAYAFRVADRVAPFGEARASGFERARPGARLAVALAGPVGVYVFLAALCVIAFLLGAGKETGTTIIEVVPSGPAAAAGLQSGDRIVSVAGIPVELVADLKHALATQSEGRVELVFERDGRQIRTKVMPDANRRIAVQLGPNAGPVSLGHAIRGGAAYPYEVLAETFSALTGQVQAELSGPIGVTKATARQPEFGQRLLTAALSQTVGLIWFLLVSLALWPPRTGGRAARSPGDAVQLAEGETVAPRPGLRLLARLVDWALIAVIPSVVVPAISGVIWLIWFPLEALFLSRWGYTPGKWLLGITIGDAQGPRLPFRAAFHRSAVLWAYGYGANTLFGFVTAVLAYGSLKRDGVTYWDELDGNVVRHRRIGAARVTIVAVVLVLGLVATAAVLGDRALIRESFR
jgi:hypothetical protein